MKNVLLPLLIIFSSISYAQHVTNIKEQKIDVDFENIFAKQLDSDSHSTSFMIWIKKGVKSHKHVEHSEVIYVVEGEGSMTVDGSVFHIEPGDYFRIPKNTFHSLDVTSKTPMKVISVQAPEFLGKDRIFDENAENNFSSDKNEEADY